MSMEAKEVDRASRAAAVCVAIMSVGCATAAPEQVEAEPMGSAQRFAARQVPARPEQAPRFDEAGEPANLRAALIGQGECFRVSGLAGRVVCVPEHGVTFPAVTRFRGRFRRGGKKPGVFVGDARGLVLYASSAGRGEYVGDTYYTRLMFEEGPDHAASAGGATSSPTSTRAPEWWGEGGAPAVMREVVMGATARGEVRCGEEVFALERMGADEQRALLMGAALSAPAPSVMVDSRVTEDGVFVAVIRVTGAVGAERVEVQIGQERHRAYVADPTSRSPSRFGFEGGGVVDLRGSGRVVLGAGLPPTPLTYSSDRKVSEAFEEQVRREVAVEYEPLAGPCTHLMSSPP
jgi:hypothetical protein